MTRKSKRELKRNLDELAAESAPVVGSVDAAESVTAPFVTYNHDDAASTESPHAVLDVYDENGTRVRRSIDR